MKKVLIFLGLVILSINVFSQTRVPSFRANYDPTTGMTIVRLAGDFYISYSTAGVYDSMFSSSAVIRRDGTGDFKYVVVRETSTFVGETSFLDNVNIVDYFKHYADANTYFLFNTDGIKMVAGGLTGLEFIQAGTDIIYLGDDAWNYIIIGDTTAAGVVYVTTYNYTTHDWAMPHNVYIDEMGVMEHLFVISTSTLVGETTFKDSVFIQGVSDSANPAIGISTSPQMTNGLSVYLGVSGEVYLKCNRKSGTQFSFVDGNGFTTMNWDTADIYFNRDMSFGGYDVYNAKEINWSGIGAAKQGLKWDSTYGIYSTTDVYISKELIVGDALVARGLQHTFFSGGQGYMTLNQEGIVINFGNLPLGGKTTNWYLHANADAYWRSDGAFRTSIITAKNYMVSPQIQSPTDTNFRIRPQGTGDATIEIDADSDFIQGAGVWASTWGITSLIFSTSTTSIIASEATVEFKKINISSGMTSLFSYEQHGASRTILSAGVYGLICGTGTGHAEDAWVNNLTDVNGNSNKQEYVDTVDRKCWIGGTFTFELSGADNAGIAIFKNGSIIDESAHNHTEVSAASKFGEITVRWRDTLTAGDVIEYKALTDGGADFDLFTAQTYIDPIN